MITHTPGARRSKRTVKIPKRYGYDEETDITIYFKTLTGKTDKITINKNKKIGCLCEKYSMLICSNTHWSKWVFIIRGNRLNIITNIIKPIKTLLFHNDIIHVTLNLGGPVAKETSIQHSYEVWEKRKKIQSLPPPSPPPPPPPSPHHEKSKENNIVKTSDAKSSSYGLQTCVNFKINTDHYFTGDSDLDKALNDFVLCRTNDTITIVMWDAILSNPLLWEAFQSLPDHISDALNDMCDELYAEIVLDKENGPSSDKHLRQIHRLRVKTLTNVRKVINMTTFEKFPVTQPFGQKYEHDILESDRNEWHAFLSAVKDFADSYSQLTHLEKNIQHNTITYDSNYD